MQSFIAYKMKLKRLIGDPINDLEIIFNTKV